MVKRSCGQGGAAGPRGFPGGPACLISRLASSEKALNGQSSESATGVICHHSLRLSQLHRKSILTLSPHLPAVSCGLTLKSSQLMGIYLFLFSFWF